MRRLRVPWVPHSLQGRGPRRYPSGHVAEQRNLLDQSTHAVCYPYSVLPNALSECGLFVRFDENYGLASTQSLKNKDIPEGGAKGTILPSYVSHNELIYAPLDHHSRLGASPRLCFEKYVDVSPLVKVASIRRTNDVDLGCHRPAHSGPEPRHQGTIG